MTATSRERALESEAIVARIRPMLAGIGPALQGSVIADLTAMWLAGHAPELREQVAKLNAGLVADLVALYDAMRAARDGS